LVQSFDLSQQSEFKRYCPSPCKNSMFCYPVTNDEILRIICKLPNNEVPGKDNINSKLN